MKHYQLIGLFEIHIAEDPIHDVFENVNLFFKA